MTWFSLAEAGLGESGFQKSCASMFVSWEGKPRPWGNQGTQKTEHPRQCEPSTGTLAGELGALCPSPGSAPSAGYSGHHFPPLWSVWSLMHRLF